MNDCGHMLFDVSGFWEHFQIRKLQCKNFKLDFRLGNLMGHKCGKMKRSKNSDIKTSDLKST